VTEPIGPGAFVAVVGASGVGKDALLSYARERPAVLARFPRRVITRPPGPGEDHDPVTGEQFAVARQRGAFAVYWQAHGLWYGIPASADTDVRNGRVVVANVSRGALGELAARYQRLVVVRVTVSQEIREQRLRGRGREPERGIGQRLARPDPAPGHRVDAEIRNDGSLAEGGAQLIRVISDAARDPLATGTSGSLTAAAAPPLPERESPVIPLLCRRPAGRFPRRPVWRLLIGRRLASLRRMPSSWPALPYESWHETCDTLHAHTQVLGKLAAKLAPPEPQLQHAALRLTARGWETAPLPAPDGEGSLVVALDLRTHEAVAEHSSGRSARVALAPDRPVAAVTRELLAAVRQVAGPVEIDLAPQEVPWDVPLDADFEHARYDRDQVARYFAAATRAALVLAAFRAPYRGRSTPVNAWWGSFDLAVSLFSGVPAEPPSGDFIMRNAMDAQEIAVGWWPGDARYGKAAFYAYTHPALDRFTQMTVSPAAAHWDAALGEYILNWDDVCADPDPAALALEFARSVFRQGCAACTWDTALAASADGTPPPVS